MYVSYTHLDVYKRQALHDYFVLERFEAGVELFGTEVKSIRAGTVNLKDSFCTVKNGELFAYGIHISPYEHGSIYNRDPDRPKRLLMHRREITKLYARTKQDGLTLVPLSLYFKDSRVKVELCLLYTSAGAKCARRQSPPPRSAPRTPGAARKRRGQQSGLDVYKRQRRWRSSRPAGRL